MKAVPPLPRGRLKRLLLKESDCTGKKEPYVKSNGNNTGDMENNKGCAESPSECKTIEDEMLTSPNQQLDERGYSSDSGASSVDDHLVNPEMLNLDESFFSPTYQSQPLATTLLWPDCIDESEVIDSEVKISDSTANKEEDKMYQLFSQITDFEKQVNEANACYRNWESRVTELRDQRPTRIDTCDVPSLLTQAEGLVNPNSSNDPEWDSFEVSSPMIDDAKNIEIFVSNKTHKIGRIVDVAQSLMKLEQEKRRQLFLEFHKVHLLLLLSYGIQVNRLVNVSIVDSASQLYDSVANSNISVPEKDGLALIKSIVAYYRETVKLATKRNGARTVKIKKGIRTQLVTREASCRKMFNVILLTLLRFLGIRARLVIHLDVVPKSPPILKKAPKAKINPNLPPLYKERYRDVPLTTTEILKRKPEIQKIFKLPQLDGADGDASDGETLPKKVCINNLTNKPRLWKLKSKTSLAVSSQTQDRTTNESELPKPIHSNSELQAVKLVPSKFFRKKPSSKPHLGSGKKIKKNDSNDDKIANSEKPNLTRLIMHKTATAPDLTLKKKHRVPQLDTWIECFLEQEQRWTVVEAALGEVDCMEQVIELIQDPPVYVFAFEANGTVVDVSQRYWWRNEQMGVKQRVDKKWLKKAISQYRPRAVDIAFLLEQLEFRQLKFRAPMPTTFAQFKNHPSYCLTKDLQKFQAIYPPDAPPLGFIHGEPIYARECVHTLHSREVWLRHAKVIRMHELPYKVVKSKLRREQTNLELFGHWQTEEYVPPEPVDGIVPRNAYGNIEIFKDCMLPKGTVHLKQFGLSHICRKLRIDYAVAVVGFGIHAGGNHPVFDGIVICAEHRDRLLEAWEIHQEESAQKKKEKREQLVLKNWVKLVKGLVVRRKLKNKYNFDGM